MPDLFPRVLAILPRYLGDPTNLIEPTARLKDLGIEEPDFPMIVIDVEDACNVDIRYDATFADCTTVADLAALLAAKLVKSAPPASQPRPKSNWLSTTAARR
jgi:acyl carrier protein